MLTISRKSQLGITLIELLIVLSIMAIVSTMAFPAFSELVANHRARQMQWQWQGFLAKARSASVSHQRWVTVCPMVNNQCTSALTNPWVSFFDDNTNAQIDLPDETIINEITPNEKTTFVMYKGNTNLSYFRYRASGASGNLRGFTVCPDGEVNHRAFHLSSTHLGRIRFAKDTNADGIVDRQYQGAQQNVTCPNA